MLYPAFVELGNEEEAYSVVLPDFKGCYTATDTQEQLPKAVQEAVELYFEGEDFALPTPSTLSQLKNSNHYDYDGVWMFFNIDTAKLSSKAKRINITFPNHLLAHLDQQAKALHISRSGLLQKLVSQEINQ